MSAAWLAERTVAGVLSGTSADGIDVVLARPTFGEAGAGPVLSGLEARAFGTEPFPEGLLARVRSVLDGQSPTLREIAVLDRDLGRAFGEAARVVARRHGIEDLALVASHGQTVFHHDGDSECGAVTLQLGDGDMVAEAAGCAVASDFRRRDIAAGGEGAPLVALVDHILFGAAPRPLAVLNLGGIANWTVLPGGPAGQQALGFDTGPAGALLDGLARRLLGQPMDRGGAVAASGQVHMEQLAKLMTHPFLQVPPPKSTGRDTFGEDWIDGLVGEWSALSCPDSLATGASFVVRAAVEGLFRWGGVEGPLHVAVAGGGTHHRPLMDGLESELRGRPSGPGSGAKMASFGSSSRFGVPVDAREALAFAALGVRLAVGEPSTQPSVTGALPGRCLGKWSCAPVPIL